MRLNIKIDRKVPDLVTDVTDATQKMATRQKCTTSKHKLRQPCHVEITFKGKQVFLRACEVLSGDGALIPVKDHEDANRKAAQLCACQSQGKKAYQCAVSLGWKDGELGRL